MEVVHKGIHIKQAGIRGIDIGNRSIVEARKGRTAIRWIAVLEHRRLLQGEDHSIVDSE